MSDERKADKTVERAVSGESRRDIKERERQERIDAYTESVGGEVPANRKTGDGETVDPLAADYPNPPPYPNPVPDTYPPAEHMDEAHPIVTPATARREQREALEESDKK